MPALASHLLPGANIGVRGLSGDSLLNRVYPSWNVITRVTCQHLRCICSQSPTTTCAARRCCLHSSPSLATSPAVRIFLNTCPGCRRAHSCGLTSTSCAQEIIHEYDERGVGMSGPRRMPQRRARGPRSRRGAADASARVANLSPRPAGGAVPPLRAEYGGLGVGEGGALSGSLRERSPGRSEAGARLGLSGRGIHGGERGFGAAEPSAAAAAAASAAVPGADAGRAGPAPASEGGTARARTEGFVQGMSGDTMGSADGAPRAAPSESAAEVPGGALERPPEPPDGQPRDMQVSPFLSSPRLAVVASNAAGAARLSGSEGAGGIEVLGFSAGLAEPGQGPAAGASAGGGGADGSAFGSGPLGEPRAEGAAGAVDAPQASTSRWYNPASWAAQARHLVQHTMQHAVRVLRVNCASLGMVTKGVYDSPLLHHF